MEKARKKLRVCLACLVMAAVIVGVIYYFHDVKGETGVTGGTLITISGGIRSWL